MNESYCRIFVSFKLTIFFECLFYFYTPPLIFYTSAYIIGSVCTLTLGERQEEKFLFIVAYNKRKVKKKRNYKMKNCFRLFFYFLFNIFLFSQFFFSFFIFSVTGEELTQLDVSQNQLQNVPSLAIKNLHHLLILNLNHNRISQIHNKAFEGLDTLEILTLYENKINVVEAEAFRGLEK